MVRPIDCGLRIEKRRRLAAVRCPPRASCRRTRWRRRARLVERWCRETSSVCCVERQAQWTMSNSPMGVAEGEYEKACPDWGADPDKRDRRFRSVLVPQRNPRGSRIRDDAVEGDRTACISDQARINGASMLTATA